MILIPEKNLMYLAVPKTASTAITMSLWSYFKGVTSFSAQELALMRELHDGHGTLPEIQAEAEEVGLDLAKYTNVVMSVRNPFDRLVSYAAWKMPEAFAVDSYAAMTTALYDNNVFTRPQSDYYVEGARIIRFESLFVDYLNVIQDNGLEVEPLQFRMVSAREKTYGRYFNSTLRSLVEQRYARDLELFNYTF